MNLELEALLSNEFGWNAHLWLPLPAPPGHGFIMLLCSGHFLFSVLSVFKRSWS